MLRRLAISTLILTSSVSVAQSRDKSPRGQAQWLLERLTGVKWPGNSPLIFQMEQAIRGGDRQGAVEIATQQQQFLNVKVKQFALKMSTRDETVRTPFNDFAASFIGVTRDGTDARELLHGNFFYAATDPARLNGVTIRSDLAQDIIGSNRHYQDLENNGVNIGAALVRTNGQMIAGNRVLTVVGTSGQTSQIDDPQPIPSPDPAGVLTSRAFMEAHATAGTNRRLVEYAFRQFMCTPIQDWADTSAADTRVGRDVDRMPGGENSKYLTTCKGCHTVMDGFRGAFAKFDWGTNLEFGANTRLTGAIIHVDNGARGTNLRANIVNATQGVTTGVIRKLNRPDFIQYQGGYVSTDDSFVNNANRGLNATRLGWRDMAPDEDPLLSGRSAGVHAFGRLLAGSRKFSQCMAEKVWRDVCQVEYDEAEMAAIYSSLGTTFESVNFRLKKLFEAVALHPRCRR